MTTIAYTPCYEAISIKTMDYSYISTRQIKGENNSLIFSLYGKQTILIFLNME